MKWKWCIICLLFVYESLLQSWSLQLSSYWAALLTTILCWIADIWRSYFVLFSSILILRRKSRLNNTVLFTRTKQWWKKAAENIFVPQIFHFLSHMNATHTPTQRFSSLKKKRPSVSAVNWALRIPPLMCTMSNKAELLPSFTPQRLQRTYTYTHTHTHTLARMLDKLIPALYVGCFLMSSHTNTCVHPRQKLNLSLITEDRGAFIHTNTNPQSARKASVTGSKLFRLKTQITNVS